MHTVEINGKSVRTNLNENYSFTDGNEKKTMTMHLEKNGESNEEMFSRLVDCDYTT